MSLPWDIEQALEETTARLARFSESRDPDAILAAEAVQARDTLMESAASGPTTIDILYAVGMMCWYRYAILPEGPDEIEFRYACDLLAPVYRYAPERFPNDFQEIISEIAQQIQNRGRTAAYNTALDVLENFQATGDIGLLQHSVQLLKELAPDFAESPDEGHYLANLSFALRTLYDFTGDQDILETAISAGERAVSLPQDGPGELANALANLGTSLECLLDLTPDDELANKIHEIFQAAVSIAPAGSPDRVIALSGLSSALRKKYESTGDVAYLLEAIQQARNSLEAFAQVDGNPEDHGLDEGALLFNLASHLGTVYSNTGDKELLYEELSILRHSLQLTREGHPYRPLRYMNLGTCLDRIFDLTGDQDLLDEAIAAHRTALRLTPKDSPNRAAVLGQLASGLTDAYMSKGDPADLTTAAALGREATQLIRDDGAHSGVTLNTIGNTLYLLHGLTGEQAYLWDSLDLARRSVNVTSIHDPNYSTHISNLANILARLSDASGRTTLFEAIDAARAALEYAPANSPLLGEYESNLAGILMTAQEREKGDRFLTDAIEMARRSVVHTPQGSADLPRRQEFLALALRQRYKYTKDISALRQAVYMTRLAIAGSDERDPTLGVRILNLGSFLYELYRDINDNTAIALSAEFFRRAVSALPESHYYHATAQMNTGLALEIIGGEGQGDELLERALDYYAHAANNASAPTMTRMKAAHRWAIVAMLLDHKLAAVGAVNGILNLLPQTAGRSLERGEREYRLSWAWGLPQTCAGILISAGEPERAVEVLEETRGLLFAEALNDQRSLADLRQAGPELADRFSALVKEFAALDDQAHATGMSDMELSAEELLAQQRLV